VTQKELNLFQLTSGLMAKPSASSMQIVRSDRSEAASGDCLTDDRPDHLRGKAGTPNLTGLSNSAKENASDAKRNATSRLRPVNAPPEKQPALSTTEDRPVERKPYERNCGVLAFQFVASSYAWASSMIFISWKGALTNFNPIGSSS
jgi:hypothetical protein